MAQNVREGQFFIVRASAGSGKTFRLVQDYLTCCLRHDDPHYFRRILAITFTNKAAQEMKDRIMQDVVAVSLGEGAMWETLTTAPSDENAAAHLTFPPGEIQRRARMLSEAMLHHFLFEMSIYASALFVRIGERSIMQPIILSEYTHRARYLIAFCGPVS